MPRRGCAPASSPAQTGRAAGHPLYLAATRCRCRSCCCCCCCCCLLLLRRRRGPPVVLHSNPRPSFVSAQGRSKLEIPYTLRSKKQRVQQIEHDEGKVVKKPSTQPPKQDAYMVVLSRAVPRSCPCPIGAAKFPPPTRRSERRNPFKPRLRRPLRASKRWNGLLERVENW